MGDFHFGNLFIYLSDLFILDLYLNSEGNTSQHKLGWSWKPDPKCSNPTKFAHKS